MNDETKTDATHPTKSAYLKEAMRQAELRIEEQYITNITLERKAGLLGTFCVAVIGYLGSTEFYVFQFCGISESVGKVILLMLEIGGIIPLVVATGYSICVFNMAHFIQKGVDPVVMLDPYYDYDYNKLAEHYLGKFKNRFEKTNNVLDNKVNRLKSAQGYLKMGLFFSFLFLLLNEIARASS